MKTSFLKKIISGAVALSLSFAAFVTVAFAEGDAERAERFVGAVEQFQELSDLDDKISHLEAVKGADVYFADESYEGVTEALNALRRYEEQISSAARDCDAFIEAVETALMTDKSDYTELKAALTLAESYLSKLDSTYDGIIGAKSDYAEIAAELKGREDYTKAFLAAVKTMGEKTDYKSKKEALELASAYILDDKFIETYEGVSEAMSAIAAAETLLSEAVVSANSFISLINALGNGTDLVAAMNTAYEALSVIDITAPGVLAAKAMLEAAKDSFNENVKETNADWGLL